MFIQLKISVLKMLRKYFCVSVQLCLIQAQLIGWLIYIKHWSLPQQPKVQKNVHVHRINRSLFFWRN